MTADEIRGRDYLVGLAFVSFFAGLGCLGAGLVFGLSARQEIGLALFGFCSTMFYGLLILFNRAETDSRDV